MEAEDRTLLEPIMDLLSWLRYKTTASNIDTKKQDSTDWMLWLLIPLGAYLSWRFYTKQRVEQKEKTDIETHIVERFGIDSPFYPLLKQLERQVDNRQTGESLSKWIQRILPDTKAEKYFKLITLHNRYRFNPTSDKEQEKQSIKIAIEEIARQ
jgi:hypothetical protein